MPVLFDEGQFCVMNTLVHGIVTSKDFKKIIEIVDFKFSPTPMEAPRSETIQNGMDKQQKNQYLMPEMKNFNEFLAYKTDNCNKSAIELRVS